MKEVKIELIQKLKIDELGYDFMGYTFRSIDELDFHHLIVPRKDCTRLGIDKGYHFWNGAILMRKTAHRYLHFIEEIDRELFCLITQEMIKENFSQELKIEYLKQIREYLLYFEEEYEDEINKKGKHIIKPTYFKNRINL